MPELIYSHADLAGRTIRCGCRGCEKDGGHTIVGEFSHINPDRPDRAVLAGGDTIRFRDIVVTGAGGGKGKYEDY